MTEELVIDPKAVATLCRDVLDHYGRHIQGGDVKAALERSAEVIEAFLAKGDDGRPAAVLHLRTVHSLGIWDVDERHERRPNEELVISIVLNRDEPGRNQTGHTILHLTEDQAGDLEDLGHSLRVGSGLELAIIHTPGA